MTSIEKIIVMDYNNELYSFLGLKKIYLHQDETKV